MKKSKQTASTSNSSRDIIELIVEDHKPLKKLVKIMKDSEASLPERRAAFKEFYPLLSIHARSEEQVLYKAMKEQVGLREQAYEGDEEHSLATQVMEEVMDATDVDIWGAKVKVLAELVEHHLKEEEEEHFPRFKKVSSKEERLALGKKYAEAIQEINSDDDDVEEPDLNFNQYDHSSTEKHH